jgi:ATP-binding cassette subfamily B protein
VSQNINKKSSIYQQNLSRLSTFAQEIFSGIRVVKAYTLEPQKQAEYEVLSAESKQKYMNLSTTSALFGPLMILLIGLSNLIVIYVGGNMYMEGKIADIGIIAQFILYINMLTWPVASLGWVSSMVQEAEASQKRINEFLKTEPEIKNHIPNETKIEGKIEFKNVSFTYIDTNIEALKNISFTLEKGKTLGIVGNTGSGKSTLATLISRLYDLNLGEILIDDIPIKQLNLNNLRDAIAVVPQDAFLFSDTIKNNIKFGKATATDDEVIEVAKKAVIHDNIIGFTHQYETILGERGITLSGGQKQRVSIARALLKEAPILVLDDCLSAVDTETEEKILQNLWQHTQQKTTLIISHRISSVKNADAILVLENGKIIQQGTHNQLIAQEGYYKNLYLKQLAEG